MSCPPGKNSKQALAASVFTDATPRYTGITYRKCLVVSLYISGDQRNGAADLLLWDPSTHACCKRCLESCNGLSGLRTSGHLQPSPWTQSAAWTSEVPKTIAFRPSVLGSKAIPSGTLEVHALLACPTTKEHLQSALRECVAPPPACAGRIALSEVYGVAIRA